MVDRSDRHAKSLRMVQVVKTAGAMRRAWAKSIRARKSRASNVRPDIRLRLTSFAVARYPPLAKSDEPYMDHPINIPSRLTRMGWPRARDGALLDRIAHHVHSLETNGERYRLRHSRRARSSNTQPSKRTCWLVPSPPWHALATQSASRAASGRQDQRQTNAPSGQHSSQCPPLSRNQLAQGGVRASAERTSPATGATRASSFTTVSPPVNPSSARSQSKTRLVVGALLAWHIPVRFQDGVNDAGTALQFRPPHRCRLAMARRCQKTQHPEGSPQIRLAILKLHNGPSS